jgi:hypothetical protein
VPQRLINLGDDHLIRGFSGGMNDGHGHQAY